MLDILAWFQTKGQFECAVKTQAQLYVLIEFQTNDGQRRKWRWIGSKQAMSVRGPTHDVQRGKAPILAAHEAKDLLESIPTETAIDLRDRALIALMTDSFARVSAAVGMNVEDIIQTNGRSWVRLNEKRGAVHELPIHHKLLDHLDAYLQVAGHRDDPKAPLFRKGKGRSGDLGELRLSRHDAHAMVRRRAIAAGVSAKIGNHSFRGTGITTFLENEGTLELAQERGSRHIRAASDCVRVSSGKGNGM